MTEEEKRREKLRKAIRKLKLTDETKKQILKFLGEVER